MSRLIWASLATTLTVFAAGEPVTFNKEVLPILQKNCQNCHRPGEVAPMSFLDYQSARPWAKAIKAAVVTGKMPPWFADARYGHWANEKRLADADIKTLAAWADGGALEGNAKDKSAPVQWTEGWNIKPDHIVSMPEPFPIPAKGILELTHFIVPSGFTKDTWITSIEIRPSDPSVVHHVVVQVIPHDPKVKYGEPIWTDKPRDELGDQITKIKKRERTSLAPRAVGGNLEAVYLPGGSSSTDYSQWGAAKLIPAGSDIYIGMHYTPNGKATKDQTRVGFTLAKEEPTRRFITFLPISASDEESFRIPAGASNWGTGAEVVFNENAELVWFMPHMHQRGKDMTFKLTYPTGESEVVLSVPKYNFAWQFDYVAAKPILVPKGTKMEITAHYDNSANNAFNPNPNKDVWWGEQTWEEMMAGWFAVVVDRKLDPKKIVTYDEGTP